LEAGLVRFAVALRGGEGELARELEAKLGAESKSLRAPDLAARWGELAAGRALQEGRAHEAIPLARIALDEATRSGRKKLCASARELLARVYPKEGAPAAARPHREGAARLREELGGELPTDLRPPRPPSAPLTAPPSDAGLVVSILRILGSTS